MGGFCRDADSCRVLQAPNTDTAAVEEVVSRVEAVRIVVPQTQRTFIPALPKSLQEQVLDSVSPCFPLHHIKIIRQARLSEL